MKTTQNTSFQHGHTQYNYIKVVAGPADHDKSIYRLKRIVEKIFNEAGYSSGNIMGFITYFIHHVLILKKAKNSILVKLTISIVRIITKLYYGVRYKIVRKHGILKLKRIKLLFSVILQA